MTPDEGPAPLIDSVVDLRDFKEFPLQFERLFASDTWISCNPEEKNAALRLWCKSWHQEPAGSLPTNDRLLANLAGYGEAVPAWMKVKAQALIGWILCNDGRLYHPVVCEIAADKWSKKTRKKEENARDRERKARKRGAVRPDNSPIPPDKPPVSAGQEDKTETVSGGNPAENALKGSEVKIPPVVPQGDTPEFFETFWREMPKRGSSPNPKPLASKRFNGLLASKEATTEDLIRAAKNYAAACRKSGIDGTEKVQQAATFLGPEKQTWRQYAAAPERPASKAVMVGSPEWYEKQRAIGAIA